MDESPAMDWQQEIRRIHAQQATQTEILQALTTAPESVLPDLLEAVADGVQEGDIAITPMDWKPVLQRLKGLRIAWPGPLCEQCGSPREDAPGQDLCYFCQ